MDREFVDGANETCHDRNLLFQLNRDERYRLSDSENYN